MRSEELRVAVVGGGVAGLAAANALVRRGVEVSVFEQAPELGEVGAGVLITPQSVRALTRMGMGPALAELGGHVGPGSQYHRMDGTPVAPIRTADSRGEHTACGMHRADLVALLATALPSGVVHTGYRCTALEQDDHAATLTFDNGRQVRADVVVAANGIQSGLQHHVVRPSPPSYSGSVAYRGLIAAADLPSWPRGAHLVWMGEQKHFMVYPVRGGSLLNYVGFLPSDEQAEESWSGTGDAAALADAFAGWDTRIGQLLALVDTPFWWGLYDREPLTRWSQGRLTLVGDAAHPMLPHLGQGANQSIEDGVALAVVLAGADPDSAPEALRAYERLRRPRAAQVQLGSRANGARYDSRYDDLGKRDAEIADSGNLRSWLYDYDVEQAANEVVASSHGEIRSRSSP